MFSNFYWRIYKSQLSKIKLVVLDVDGVLTDGGLYLNSDGQIFRKFDVKDGLGINLLIIKGIDVAIISGGDGNSINTRAKQLGIKFCKTNVKDKSKEILKLQNLCGYKISETLFVGDDLNDIVVKPYVSFLVATKDAISGFKKKANLVLNNNAGNGAVREIADLILRSKGYLRSFEEKGWLNTNN